MARGSLLPSFFLFCFCLFLLFCFSFCSFLFLLPHSEMDGRCLLWICPTHEAQDQNKQAPTSQRERREALIETMHLPLLLYLPPSRYSGVCSPSMSGFLARSAPNPARRSGTATHQTHCACGVRRVRAFRCCIGRCRENRGLPTEMRERVLEAHTDD